MDRLNEIGRPQGYPWCAEEIKILEERADYLNGLLDCLALGPGSCVFVQIPPTAQFNKLLTYIVPEEGPDGTILVANSFTHGELFWLDSNGMSYQDLLAGTAAARHIDIADVHQHVEGTQNGRWLDCYITKTAKVVDNGTPYRFYALNDLLRPAVWEDLEGFLGAHAVKALSGAACLDLCEDYQQRIRKSGQEIDVDLCYVVTGNISSSESVHHDLSGVTLGLAANERRLLNCFVKHYSSINVFTLSVAQCFINNGGINIYGISATNNSGTVNLPKDEVYVWGRVSLK